VCVCVCVWREKVVYFTQPNYLMSGIRRGWARRMMGKGEKDRLKLKKVLIDCWGLG